MPKKGVGSLSDLNFMKIALLSPALLAGTQKISKTLQNMIL